jgi:enoyl-CoA hydratase/carnithine racemase
MVALKTSIVFTVCTMTGAVVQGPEAAIPWTMLANGGIGLTLLFAIWMFMRFLREERADRSAERDKTQDTMKAMATGFADRVEDSNGRTEQALRDLAQELRQARGGGVQPGRPA